MKPITSHSCKLSDAEAEQLREHLVQRGYEFRDVPHARFAAGREAVTIVFYTSGKLVVQGKGTREFVEFVLEPEILKRPGLGYESVLEPDRFLPRLGIDESGKGDFFGPLCIAGVYVNETVVRRWSDLGVRDSKSIGSDRRIADLARAIRETSGCVVDVVTIGNDAYNRLHAKMKSVNTILAWGHARVIENLLRQRSRMNPAPVRAISDQFARSKTVVAGALMDLGRGLELVQRHRAETDLAVAAASILARDAFVRRLGELGRGLGMELPKGGGGAVDAAARSLVERQGVDALRKVAKMHFQNALRATRPPAPAGAAGDPMAGEKESRKNR